MSQVTDDREKRFWNNYIAQLSERNIKPALFQWYVRHCEQFIRYYTDVRLKEHTDQSVQDYFSNLLESNKLKAWQKRQVVDAIHCLFLSIHSPFCKQVDWDYWKMSCKELEADHVSNARNNTPVVTGRSKNMDLEGSANAPEVEKLIYQVRAKGYSIRTEKTYVHWVNRFLKFCSNSHTQGNSARDVIDYLSFLAVDKGVSSSTQALALNAIVFYFKMVLNLELGDVSQFVKAKKRQKLPVVLSADEVNEILAELQGVQLLLVSLLYGCGLRLMEAIRLRVQDIDFAYQQIIIRNAKGNKERVVPLPAKIQGSLKAHLKDVKAMHETDLKEGYGSVYMPAELVRKYGKNDQLWIWQYVFPSAKLSLDPKSKAVRRHHLHESTLQKSVRYCARKLGIAKRVTCHTFRHSFATHHLERGMDIRMLQELLGHSDVATTMIYTHTANFSKGKTSSPLDFL
ncbi:hypothetical protein A3752_17335 [Oleiphilus sp. HI0081]|nr:MULTISPECIES: integron integrase [unclassified Oleiphilus]KZY72411.1 hypothetical protein A3740_20765 [Oleiphilus sp. HI0068]KZY80406.1 hypothetical protein A3741_18935 [Oleiphilus sp. HI0069]KZY86593.1 hypothetical protein A3743_16795 [Oleiphilus sp. HI0072]KZZ30267.1 hypothetical protein A3752_17335 [Oleiphilus sp. HI0081]KZY39803.1 hypothetical protein A3729_14445 [Oleiphilus sp. HI0043]